MNLTNSVVTWKRPIRVWKISPPDARHHYNKSWSASSRKDHSSCSTNTVPVARPFEHRTWSIQLVSEPRLEVVDKRHVLKTYSRPSKSSPPSNGTNVSQPDVVHIIARWVVSRNWSKALVVTKVFNLCDNCYVWLCLDCLTLCAMSISQSLRHVRPSCHRRARRRKEADLTRSYLDSSQHILACNQSDNCDFFQVW